MITIRPIAQRIELTFWIAIIPLMSESKLVQKAFIKSVQVTNYLQLIYDRKPTYLLSAIGFGLGIILGVISVMIIPPY